MRASIRREGDWFDNALFRWNWNEAATRITETAGPRLTEALRDASPRKPAWDHPERGAPGELADSIDYSATEQDSALRIEWAAHVPWAKWVVRGTPPHRILPHGPYPLRWTDDTGEHQHWAVNHPGASANPFQERVLAEKKTEVVDDVSDAVANTFRQQG